MYDTRLGGFLRGLGFPLGVTLSDDYSCGGDRSSLVLPYEHTGEACTREFTGAVNIFLLHKYCLNHGFIQCLSNIMGLF